MPIGPFTKVVAKTKAKAKDFNAALTTLEAKFAGNITSDDLAPSAGIKGTQISSTAGQRITTENLEEGCVTAARLKSDASTSANRAVGGSHIQDGAIGANHMGPDSVVGANVLNATLGSSKLKVNKLLWWSSPYSYVTGYNITTLETGLSATANLVLGVYFACGGEPLTSWNGGSASLPNFCWGTHGGTWKIWIHCQTDFAIAANAFTILYLTVA